MMNNELLSRAKSGDKEAENELFDYLRVRFKLFAQRKVWEAGEELAQEACMIVAQKYKNETFTVGFEAWALGILKNVIANYFRAKKRRRELWNTRMLTDPDRGITSEEQLQTLRLTLIECMNRLDRKHPVYAKIVQLGLQGLEIAEICHRLGMTRNNAYVTLNRARNKLSTCLAEGRM